jgi:hypothetical protein
MKNAGKQFGQWAHKSNKLLWHSVSKPLKGAYADTSSAAFKHVSSSRAGQILMSICLANAGLACNTCCSGEDTWVLAYTSEQMKAFLENL